MSVCRLPLGRFGKQLRFEAMVVNLAGRRRVVELLHDTGAVSNIIRPGGAIMWADRGNGAVYMDGFVGGEHIFFGETDLK
jgi:hypothetical protein